MQVMEELFECWFNKQSANTETDKELPSCPSTFIRTKRGKTNQPIFLVAEESFKRCIQVAEWHARQCPDDLNVSKLTMKGHVVKTNLKCKNGKHPHTFSWSSSPYLPSNEYLVNSRVNHGFICSGILPSDYTRFTRGAGIGCISSEKRTSFFGNHKNHIQKEHDDSISTALWKKLPRMTVWILLT